MSLINCPECQQNISDKALSCPHCGYPLSSTPLTATTLKKAPSRSSAKPLRNPNGFGSVRKMHGNLRRPFGAFPPAKYDDNGRNISTKAIGYYATYKEAYEALLNYHNTPIFNPDITFGEVSEKFIQDKFSGRKALSDKTKAIYSSGIKWLAPLNESPISELRTAALQNVIDSCDKGESTIRTVKNLLEQIMKYALEHDYIVKDYSQFVQTPDRKKTEKGQPFTEEEIALLWQHKDIPAIQITLILMYSGHRIGELEVVDIDLNDNVFKGGLKNEQSRSRTVPIHSATLPFVKAGVLKDYKAYTFRRHSKKAWSEIGINYAPNGAVRTPHDLRHTFSWLCDKYGVDSLTKHLLMGHTPGSDVESNTYGHRSLEELREAVELLPTLYQR